MITPRPKINGKDILLLLLYFPGKTNKTSEGIIGATRLMKAMFLFEHEFKKDFSSEVENFPEFMAWKFGPWSDQVMDDIEFFKGIKFIIEESQPKNQDILTAEEEELSKWKAELLESADSNVESDSDFYQPKKIHLTQTGKDYVEENLLPKLSENQKKIIANFKTKISSLSLFSILSYVYKKYSKTNKDWTINSVIRKDILN